MDTALRQSISSSSQLADVAISSLRKSLQPQRSGSPGPRSPPNDAPGARSRVTLEDRLRAKFAIGDASTGTSPNPSIRSTPSGTPLSVADHPLSSSPAGSTGGGSVPERPSTPRSMPLPPSPDLTPSIKAPQPVLAQPLEPEFESATDDHEADRESEPAPPESSTTSSEAAPPEDISAGVKDEDPPVLDLSAISDENPAQQNSDAPLGSAIEVDDGTVSNPENPLSETPSVELSSDSPSALMEPLHTSPKLLATAPSDQDNATDTVETLTVPSNDTDGSLPDPVMHEETSAATPELPDIEGLRERLKLVEQRFTGDAL